MSADDDMERFLNAGFRFWVCPVEEHRNLRDSNGAPCQEVEWVDGVAYCLFRGCGRTSVDPDPGMCSCDGYECTGECCGKGSCTCTPTHLIPPVGSGLTPCCGRSPGELPRADRITEDADVATCAGRNA